jgi:hypothetical protein
VTANSQSEKGTESQNYFRMQIERIEHILSSHKLGLKQNEKFDRFLSLCLRNINAY